MGPRPEVAAVRLAVRRALADVGPADRVLVACSGGADSLALLAAAVFEARRPGWHVVGVTVDHDLQAGSAEHAADVVAQMARLGAAETASVAVTVDPGGRGTEAAAREARYAALLELADRFGSEVVLLGHTLDDQAETVLLGLARGSGGRAVAGMRETWGPFRRPLLGITRAETEAACRAEGVKAWDDPHNTDPRFTRPRVRHTVMPVLEAELGPGIAAALARTAAGLQEDLDVLDDLAVAAFDEARIGGAPGVVALDVPVLATLATAVRRRVLRSAATAAGCPPGELFRVHVLAVDALVGDYHGQQRVELPGHVHAVREGAEVRLARVGPPGGAGPVAG
jgi:tRNA(Ile)-lysidine synthase